MRRVTDRAGMAAYEGRQVTVILNEDDPDAQMVGVLISVDPCGEAVIGTSAGRRYGWPALAILVEE